MLARLYRLLPRPRRVSAPLLGFVVLIFVGSWFSTDYWPNFAAEAWGVFGAGFLIWLVQERYSSSYQRQVWLEDNLEILKPLLEHISYGAAGSAMHALGLSEADRLTLYGGSWTQRRRIVERETERLRPPDRDPFEVTFNRPKEVEDAARKLAWDADLPRQVQLARDTVTNISGPYGAILSQIPELDVAIRVYDDWCTKYIELRERHPSKPCLTGTSPFDSAELFASQVAPDYVIALGGASLSLVQTCANILRTAGALK